MTKAPHGQWRVKKGLVSIIQTQYFTVMVIAKSMDNTLKIPMAEGAQKLMTFLNCGVMALNLLSKQEYKGNTYWIH